MPAFPILSHFARQIDKAQAHSVCLFRLRASGEIPQSFQSIASKIPGTITLFSWVSKRGERSLRSLSLKYDGNS